MSPISICLAPPPPPPLSLVSHSLSRTNQSIIITSKQRHSTITAFASNSASLNSILKGCKTCRGKGATECPGCKGTGRNKKNGNIFERWKCFECQGFGLKGCPSCGNGGLTPEQRGER
ncbi:PREDICTED: uncharacterized protein LOC109324987 [Lupinus angustifolius]|uniref:uncharacterized protein LOC109324987 n=1 Tax=Lupinus angustifolius TaxID=3871 RepID=UPI00092F6A99|nr:PREDICTED: uncharacterized protein LOC109324987 [Lupinus angustifolius]